MRFFKDSDDAHIVLEGSEEERQVLRAIVQASFDLAHPVGLTVVDYHPEHRLTDSETDQWIRSVPRSHDRRVIEMNYVQGRQCKTVLSKETPGHFRLDAKLFERYRGSCMPLLKRAQELISEDGGRKTENGLLAFGEAKAMAASK